LSHVPTFNGKLRGIIAPLVTPLRNWQTMDLPSLERLVEHVLAGKVHGLFVLGSTGEALSLSIDLRCALVQALSEAVAARVPIIVNVSDTAFAHSLRLAHEAAKCGAIAVAISPPCYFQLDQRQLSAYVAHFAERSPLPVFLYNIPQFAHTAFAEKTVCELAELPNVIGLKNSNGNLDYLRAVQAGLRQRADFSVVVGNEETLLPALIVGADGGVCGGANMFPKLFVELFEAATNGRVSETEQLQQTVVRVAKAVYAVGAPETSYLRGLKRALSLLGFIQDVLAEPLQNFDRAEQAELDSRFARVLESMNEPTGIQEVKTL
jgi:dihydrodipicolinate synthase/N-acetylneuraminate lyase